MAWIQLKVSVPKHYAEDVGDVLAAHGAVAVTFQDAHDTPVLEPLPAETRLWKSTSVAALYSVETDITQMLMQLQNDLAVQRIVLSEQWEPVVELLEDQDWLRESMAQFQPLQFGHRLWICPSWLPTPDPTAVNVVLDPGLAFGTGTHPTTALCLEWLESLHVLGRRVIDFGCGSGILAIAALKLGACSAVGIDIDPQALQASHDNAQRNGVADRLTLYLANQQPSDLQAEVVVANILAGPLKALATPISQLVAAGGHLALSGILLEQAEAVIVAYHKQWRCYSMTEREGWCCITAQVRDQQSEKEKTNNQRS